MSRKKKARHRKQGGWDRHHILHYRRFWSKGCLQLLRRAFVYELPIEVHHELHSNVGSVPPLSDAEARQLWLAFKQLKYEMDLFEALEWLVGNAPNPEFEEAIKEQQRFLLENL